MSLGQEIQEVRFTPTRLRPGYDPREVDDFLDVLTDAADAGEDLRPLVGLARFTVTKRREGYDMAEVDLFLSRMAGASPVLLPATDPGVITERRGLVARVMRKDR